MNGIETVGPRLREARERQKKSIAEIAEATRISRKILEEIESGKVPAMPPSYVSAFVRTYARQVGLDLTDGDQTPLEPPVSNGKTEKLFHGQTAYVRPPAPGGTTQQGKVLLALSTGIIALLAVLFLYFRQSPVAPATGEVPFAEVIREHEARYAGAVLPFVADSSSFWHGARSDSLVLDAVSSDTVWVRLVIDGGWMREYSMMPGTRLRWKGRESFILSLGDGGVVSFALNGRNLGPLGKISRPLWNARVDRGTVPRPQKSGGQS